MSWSYKKSVAFTLFYFLILVYSLNPFDFLKPLIFEISSFSGFLKIFSSLSLVSLNLKTREIGHNHDSISVLDPRFYEVIKPQLSTKFQLFIKTKIPTNKTVSCFKSFRSCIYHANKCKNVKMPTVVGVLSFMSRINFVLS